MTFPACSGCTKRSLLSGGAGERGRGGPMGSPQGWRRWEGGSGMCVSLLEQWLQVLGPVPGTMWRMW